MGDLEFMQLALRQARAAAHAGEVPVGAVVVKDGVVIATGRNAPIGQHDPTAHAEVVAMRAAAQVLGNYRLDGCELFVTLEPCSMCSGAMLHARLQRVVFGAADPKTGAAGSVVNLFSNPVLNHHTDVQGGVMADVCAAMLQDFFQGKRRQQARQRRAQCPLRDDALRTPDVRFGLLTGYPWQAHYLCDLPSLAGLRLHYLDEGLLDAPKTYVCLHDSNGWSYSFRHALPGLLLTGRVLAPDLIGFGKSDKPKKDAVHSVGWHVQIIREWVERLDLQQVVWVIQGPEHQLLDALLHAMPQQDPVQVMRLPHMPDAPSDPGLQAPFPDAGHRAAFCAFARPAFWLADVVAAETAGSAVQPPFVAR